MFISYTNRIKWYSFFNFQPALLRKYKDLYIITEIEFDVTKSNSKFSLSKELIFCKDR